MKLAKVGGLGDTWVRHPSPGKGSVTVACHTHGRTVTQSETCVSEHCGGEAASLAKAVHIRGIKPAYARSLSVAAELVR